MISLYAIGIRITGQLGYGPAGARRKKTPWRRKATALLHAKNGKTWSPQAGEESLRARRIMPLPGLTQTERSRIAASVLLTLVSRLRLSAAEAATTTLTQAVYNAVLRPKRQTLRAASVSKKPPAMPGAAAVTHRTQQSPILHQPTVLVLVLPSALSVSSTCAFGCAVSVSVPLAPVMRISPLSG